MGGWERAARGTRECTCSSVADEVHERANYDAPRPPQRVHLGRAVSYMPTVSEHNERERVGDRARVRRLPSESHQWMIKIFKLLAAVVRRRRKRAVQSPTILSPKPSRAAAHTVWCEQRGRNAHERSLR